jgi:hypothetical protein
MWNRRAEKAKPSSAIFRPDPAMADEAALFRPTKEPLQPKNVTLQRRSPISALSVITRNIQAASPRLASNASVTLTPRPCKHAARQWNFVRLGLWPRLAWSDDLDLLRLWLRRRPFKRQRSAQWPQNAPCLGDLAGLSGLAGGGPQNAPCLRGDRQKLRHIRRLQQALQLRPIPRRPPPASPDKPAKSPRQGAVRAPNCAATARTRHSNFGSPPNLPCPKLRQHPFKPPGNVADTLVKQQPNLGLQPPTAKRRPHPMQDQPQSGADRVSLGCGEIHPPFYATPPGQRQENNPTP